MKKKILIVEYSLNFGGINSSLRNFLELADLSNKQIDILPMFNNGTVNDYYNNVHSNVHVLKSPFILDLWYGDFSKFSFIYQILGLPIKLIKKYLKKKNLLYPTSLFKLVSLLYISTKHYETVISFGEGQPLVFTSYIKACTRYAWIHCNLDYATIDNSRDLKFYSKYDKIYAVSKYTKNICMKYFPSLTNTFDYIYNIINKFKIEENSKKNDVFLSEISNDTFLIVSVGRIDPIKGFSRIPKIAKKLSKKITNFRWLIIGDGDEVEKNKILRNIKDENIEEKVLLTGFKYNPAPFIKRANIYVCTSISEACPMVFLEANALNTYIVSTTFPSAKELIGEHKLQGSLCTIDNLHDEIVALYNKGIPFIEYNDCFFKESINKFNSVLN